MTSAAMETKYPPEAARSPIEATTGYPRLVGAADLAPDGVRGDIGPTGAVDPEHDRLGALVGDGGAERGSDGVGAGGPPDRARLGAADADLADGLDKPDRRAAALRAHGGGSPIALVARDIEQAGLVGPAAIDGGRTSSR